MTQESWQQFFGEDYLTFSEVILSPERTAYERDAIMAMLQLTEGMRVLDLGCGQGRMSVALAGLGVRVTGYDGSAELLREARRRADQEGLSIDFVHGDMRELETDEPFDAVLNIGTAFGYIADPAADRDIMRRVARALKPGGRFLQETENRDFKLRFLRNTWEEMNGRVVISRRSFDCVTGRWKERMEWLEQGVRREANLDVRLYTATELVEMTEAAGLAVTGVRGGFDNRPLALDSPRLLLLSRKERNAEWNPNT